MAQRLHCLIQNGKRTTNIRIITPNQKNPGEAKFVDSNGNLVDEIYGVGDTFKTVRLKVTKTGELTINHRHGDPKADDKHKLSNGDELNITVVESNQKDTYNLYVYTQVLGYSGDYYGSKAENKAWERHGRWYDFKCSCSEQLQ